MSATVRPRDVSGPSFSARPPNAARTSHALSRMPRTEVRSERTGAVDAPERASMYQAPEAAKPPAARATPAVSRLTTTPVSDRRIGGRTRAPITARTIVWPASATTKVSTMLTRPGPGL